MRLALGGGGVGGGAGTRTPGRAPVRRLLAPPAPLSSERSLQLLFVSDLMGDGDSRVGFSPPRMGEYLPRKATQRNATRRKTADQRRHSFHTMPGATETETMQYVRKLGITESPLQYTDTQVRQAA